MTYEHEFSIGFQNVQGMHDGGGCKINEIKNNLSNDIEILSETWGCNCDLSFESYTAHVVASQKHQGVKKGRKSGGFVILLKNHVF